MSGRTYKRGGVDSDNVDIENAVTSAENFLKDKGIETEVEKIVSDDPDDVRFMNQEITIILAEPASESDPMFVEVNVNGDYRVGVRGEEMKLRRSHLAVLARAKQSRVRQKKIVNGDGSMGFVEENVLALTYPFQVIEDPDPRRGGPWLRRLLSNPA
jgi:hypothetical protein